MMVNRVAYSGPAITEFHPRERIGLSEKYRPWYFTVHQSFTVRWKSYTLRIPEGLETDLASIPRIIQSLIPLVGNHLQAAIVHDMCYRNKVGVSKKDADDMFLDSMRELGVPWWKRTIMYQAVNVFGSSSFKGG